MKKINIVFLVLLSFCISSCQTTNSISNEVLLCSIINNTPHEFTIDVGQVIINSDGSYNWDSIGTPDNPTNDRLKFVSRRQISPYQEMEIYGKVDNGYDLFVWGSSNLDRKYTNGWCINKNNKKIYISIYNDKLNIGPYYYKLNNFEIKRIDDNKFRSNHFEITQYDCMENEFKGKVSYILTWTLYDDLKDFIDESIYYRISSNEVGNVYEPGFEEEILKKLELMEFGYLKSNVNSVRNGEVVNTYNTNSLILLSKPQ